ncbi:PQQ-binding-like beta-propeller repeat protein [Oerskovia sp. NPDC057915]|uniref:outer membrane protein assembly factor BamB family protein n=1 Tax=Oerskovia sp. NPDC057915 TaxID=3346280 RepID=UPI0036D8DC11
MAPRRREHDAHAVELVEVAELDDDFDVGQTGATGRTTGSAGAHPRGADAGRTGAGSSTAGAGRAPLGTGAVGEQGRTRGRRVRLVLAVVLLACGAGASLAVGAVLERARADRVAAQAGGLWPVASEPASLWRASTGEGPPAAVEGQVVLTGPEGTVTARDITTGGELWTARLPPGTTTCGPDLLDPGVQGSPLVCVTDRGASAGAGRSGDRFPFLVTVLDQAGQVVGSRALTDGVEAAVPLAGGRVATAVLGTDGVVVTWEGALDGAVEQVRTVGVTPAPVDAVGSTGAEGDSTAPVEDVGLVAARGLLHVRSGEVSETFDAAGEPSAEFSSVQARGWLQEGSLPGGSSARVVDDRRTGQEDRVDVVGPDGRRRFSVAGEPFVPQVTDDGPPQVLVVRMPGFTGYDASTGHRLWHREEWPEVLWLQTDDVVVVESGSRLLALETRTGREVWQRWLPTEIVRVFTDGDSVLLATLGDELGGTGGASTSVVSVSLFDGRTEWRMTLDGDYYEVVSAQGVLFAMTRTEVVRLGRGTRRYRVGDLSHR